ncbi:hypothetical protein JK358_34240 [Nocardia sp. 2]|uniref:Uncharacterized protein n=1 Tax=Nocardia acididurans TaxID=2802282 RepID=A0ABS1MJQ6_9NOCA|nr:hypothetical protein [Nocardia acididurans]MBL1079478.1 hypothetical protein [Nocardia acididurans]
MSDPRRINRSDMVQMLWPTDGPHTPESMIAAANAIDDLWRYLAHATRGTSDACEQPADVYLAVGALMTSARSAMQALAQLANWAADLQDDDGLIHDAARNDQERAIAAAAAAGNWLFDGSCDMNHLAQHLEKASAELSHLYIDRDDVEGDE